MYLHSFSLLISVCDLFLYFSLILSPSYNNYILVSLHIMHGRELSSWVRASMYLEYPANSNVPPTETETNTSISTVVYMSFCNL